MGLCTIDIQLSNTLPFSAQKGFEGYVQVIESKAFAHSDGHVFWSLPLITKSSCVVDVKYFPFDNQKCEIRFGSWSYEKSQMDLLLHEHSFDTSVYMQNPEFHVIDWSLTVETLTSQQFGQAYFESGPLYAPSSSAAGGEYPHVVLRLHIKRKPLYYAYTVLAPTLVLCSMMVVTFLLPCDSGDKVGIGLTVFLSLYVLQLAIAEHIPESDSIPLISKCRHLPSPTPSRSSVSADIPESDFIPLISKYTDISRVQVLQPSHQ